MTYHYLIKLWKSKFNLIKPSEGDKNPTFPFEPFKFEPMSYSYWQPVASYVPSFILLIE